MKLKVYSSDGTKNEEKEISDIREFEGKKGVQALRDYIIAIQANARQGNACAKTRAEVSGTGKKPWRQKGTGNARHGSRRSPIWVGGGVAHGPRPRDYSQKVNKKIKTLALNRAIFDSATDGSFRMIEHFDVAEPKTKLFVEIVNRISSKGSVLLVDEFFKDSVILSARNIPRVFMIDADSLNAWDISRHDTVLISEKGLERLLQRLNSEG